MNDKEKYYLRKGTKIGNPSLPGGTLEAKTDFLLVEKKYYPIIGASMDYLVSAGKAVTAAGRVEIEDKERKEAAAEEQKKEDEAAKKKLRAERLDALKVQASELKIEFEKGTSYKDLEELIADKIAADKKAGENK